MNIFRLSGKVLNGEGTKKNLESFHESKKDIRTKKLVEELEWIWTHVGYLRPNFVTDPNLAWKQFQGKLTHSIQLHRTKVRRIRMAAGMAACIMIFFTARYFYPTTENELSINTIQSEKSITELPDGSIVWLNGESTLKYSDDRNQRSVSLQGEGYFEVKTDPERPFTITVEELNTTVVGTSFNINQNSDDKIVVSLITGSLRLINTESQDIPIFLSPGQQGIFDEESGKVIKTNNTDLNVLSWKTGKLVFDNEPINNVIQTLENHYDVILEQDTRSSQSRVTATFDNQPIEEVLELLQLITDIEIDVKIPDSSNSRTQ